MESKAITFRSIYANFTTYIGGKPANPELNQPARDGKEITFAKFKYTTSDEKEISFLRDKCIELPGTVTEIKPDKKYRMVELDPEGKDKDPEATSEKTQELEQEESTTKPKAKK